MTEFKKPEAKMFPVKLVRNYRPGGAFEIVGDAMGPATPGALVSNKLWAGTVVKLPVDEAKKLVAMQAAERADEIPG